MSEVLEPLLISYRSLIDCGDKIIADGRLKDLIRRISAFGLTLVKLDIRQESDKHTDVLDAITIWLGIGCYKEWPEEQKQKWLIDGMQK